MVELHCAAASLNRMNLQTLFISWTPYLIDIFRQAVNLVGARHREIFSQDHKRFFPSNVYPGKMGETGKIHEFVQTKGEARRLYERTMQRSRNPTPTKHTFPVHSWQPAAAFTDSTRA